MSADGIGVDQTPRESFMVLASAERRGPVARLKASRQAKAERGDYAGGRPAFGYEAVGGGLVVYEPEAKIVRHVFMRLRADAQRLNAEWIAKGRPFVR